MVGTAFWWTEEEAERDAAAMGLPVLTLGPSASLGDHERLRTELVESDLAFVRASTEAEQLRAQLAKRDALLHKIRRNEFLTPDERNGIDGILSASAEPSALPDPLRCSACTHADCGKFDGPRQVECRAMADNACARPGASS